VLQVVAAGEFGGAEAQLLTLMSALQDAGVDVSAHAFYEGEFAARARTGGLRVDVTPAGSRRSLADDRRNLLAHCSATHPDVLHTHGVRASVAGRHVGRKLGIPVVTTVHSDLSHDYDAWLKRFLFMRLEARTRDLSARVIAVSPALAQTLRRRGYAEARLRVIPNAVDSAALCAAAGDVAAARAAATGEPSPLRRELGLSASAQIVLCVARLHPVKRHDVLIASFAAACDRLQDASVDAQLVLVGDGELRAQVERAAFASGAAGRIHVLGARSDIPALLAQADVFALTSDMEGMPISILEAMACGLPIVATDVGGIPCEVGRDEDACGLLAGAGDTAAIAARLAQVLRDEPLRRQLARAARDRVQQHFSSAAMACAVQSVYAEVVGRSCGRVSRPR
jgi:glycosyltransferase involved in cell wall biosynthesis